MFVVQSDGCGKKGLMVTVCSGFQREEPAEYNPKNTTTLTAFRTHLGWSNGCRWVKGGVCSVCFTFCFAVLLVREDDRPIRGFSTGVRMPYAVYKKLARPLFVVGPPPHFTVSGAATTRPASSLHCLWRGHNSARLLTSLSLARPQLGPPPHFTVSGAAITRPASSLHCLWRGHNSALLLTSLPLARPQLGR